MFLNTKEKNELIALRKTIGDIRAAERERSLFWEKDEKIKELREQNIQLNKLVANLRERQQQDIRDEVNRIISGLLKKYYAPPPQVKYIDPYITSQIVWQ